jgi:glycosyltransferase involved in cell wall biosynthesis
LRILQVIHQFPPYSSQGSEIYCDQLSRELARTEDVRVFHVSNAPHDLWRRLRRETIRGLSTYHCVDGGKYARLADWPNRFLRRSFQTALDDFRPEIVHFHNFLSLGDNPTTLAAAGGAAVVYTLHDYGLICPNALLLRDDGVLCGKQDPDFFQHCCPVLIRASGRGRRTPWTARLPSLARWRFYAHQQHRPWLRACLRSVTDRAAAVLGDPRHSRLERKRDFFLAQTRRIFHEVDLFLAPSEFLRERYVSCGVPRHKIEFLRYGMRHFPAARRPGAGSVRFGYIGALHPQKGIELLLEAFRDLDVAARLDVFGSSFGSPISENYWRRISDGTMPNVFLHGQYDNGRVGEILAGLDVVVVPSIWYENSPLTIQEAFIARVPVITANEGGMAELVRDGIDGLHFRLGDAADLRRKLRYVAMHPDVLERLRDGIPAVPGIEAHAATLLGRYRTLWANRAAVPRQP